MKKLNVLIIGAHPDDCDFMCGGIALKYTALGHNVTFLSVCDGRGGHHIMPPEEIKARRWKETRNVEKLTGIEYDVWDIPDCEVTADIETRKKMVRYIRSKKPDIIFTHRTNDYHADHRTVALLVQDASYILSVPNFCPEEAVIPIPVIMYMYDSFTNPVFIPDTVVPIDDVIDMKFKMYDCHESQVYEWLAYEYGLADEVPGDPDERLEWLHQPRVPRDGTVLTEADMELRLQCDSNEYKEAYPAVIYRDILKRKYGTAADSILFAEAYQSSEYGAPLTEENRKILFPF